MSFAMNLLTLSFFFFHLQNTKNGNFHKIGVRIKNDILYLGHQIKCLDVTSSHSQRQLPMLRVAMVELVVKVEL